MVSKQSRSEVRAKKHARLRNRFAGTAERPRLAAVSYTHLDVYKRQVTYNPRYASTLIEKLLKSAIANAENNNNMSVENLYVEECYANKGPTMKRVKPRAQGRAYRIEKRMSHITIVLNER